MNNKCIAFILTIIICIGLFSGCTTTSRDENKSSHNKTTTTTTTMMTTTTTSPAQNMDWSIFDSIGVNNKEAKTIFTKLGFTYVTDLRPIGTSSINYQLLAFDNEEAPIDIMVEDSKITQVTLRYIHVADGARDAYFDDDILPKTWYYKGEKGYKDAISNRIGIIMYDTYMYDNAYYIGVKWEERELFYF